MSKKPGKRYTPEAAIQRFVERDADDCKAIYIRAYNDGWNDGEEQGQKDGYRDGKKDGEEIGRERVSETEVWQRGFDEGYQKGLEDSAYQTELIPELKKAEFDAGFRQGRAERKIQDGQDGYEHGVEDLACALHEIGLWDTDERKRHFHGDWDILSIVRDHKGMMIIAEVNRRDEMEAAMAAADDQADTGIIAEDLRELVDAWGAEKVLEALKQMEGQREEEK